MQLSRQILVLEVDQPYQYVSKLSIRWYEMMKKCSHFTSAVFRQLLPIAGLTCHAIISFTKTDSFRTLTFRVWHHVVDLYRDLSCAKNFQSLFQVTEGCIPASSFPNSTVTFTVCCVVLWIILWPKRKKQTVFVGLFWEVVNTEAERTTRNPLKHE